MAALSRRKQLFYPSPRTAKHREQAARYIALRNGTTKQRSNAYIVGIGAFAPDLIGARAKGQAKLRNDRINKAIAGWSRRPLLRTFNSWQAWASASLASRNRSLLQQHVKWKQRGLSSLLEGSVQLAREHRELIQRQSRGKERRRQRSRLRHPVRTLRKLLRLLQ